jgi:hypothetical protein
LRRASTQSRSLSRGHSAPITTATAQTNSARDSQLTKSILPTLNRAPSTADTQEVSTTLVIPWFAFWATLMRALFVRAQLLPATCARCGLRYERRALGETVCSCAS